MDIPSAQILGFVIVLTRISFFLAIVPIFGLKTISMRIKLSIVLLVSFFFALYMPTSVNLSNLTVLSGILMIGAEAIYGIALGSIIMLLFSAVKISGKIVELAVRHVIHGEPVKNTDALANPEALEQFRDRPELADR